MKRALLFAVSLAFLLAADQPGADVVKKEMKRWEGSWRLLSQVRDGQAAPAEAFEKVRIVYADGRYVTFIGEKVVQKGSIVPDPTKKPMTFDAVITEGEAKGKSLKGTLIYGIYEIDGDTRKLCYTIGDKNNRPGSFTSRPGSGHYLDIQRRVRH